MQETSPAPTTSDAPPETEATDEVPVSDPNPVDATPEATSAEGTDGGLENLFSANDGSAVAQTLELERYQQILGDVLAWVQNNVLTLNMGLQLGIIFGAIIPALMFGPKLKRLIQKHVRDRVPAGIARRAVDALATVGTLLALWITLGIASGILGGVGQSSFLVSAIQSLLAAAIFIRLVTLVIRSPFWSKVAFYIAWPIAALDAFGILDNVVAQLDAAAIPIGQATDGTAITLSALDIVRAGIIFGIFFWLASLAASLINRQLDTVEELTPSVKALLSKILSFLLPILALLFALNTIGFNLTSLAVFSGAVGLGIGLGLQQLISNFIAGFTLLADKSIKPGDVIEVDGVFGWVTEMKSRYVAVRTRDGHERLVPNAKFIDGGVVNWSHSDEVVRIHAPFGVGYGTRDLKKVQALAQEAAEKVERVVSTPKPVCNLMEFGDSSVNFDLRFWITDPSNGIANVRSEVMLNLWEALHDNAIEIPYPQLDLHIKSSLTDAAAALESQRLMEAHEGTGRNG